MKQQEFICVACPVGCALTVQLDDGGVIQNISGNSCKRGLSYAEAEVTNPTRSLTTTMCVEGGVLPLVSVKSATPLPKPLLRDCAAFLAGQRLHAPVAIGDVVCADLLGTGVDIVATSHCGISE